MRSILITGGSGSFGKAFTRRCLDKGLSERICIYSRGEHAQAQMRDELKNDPRLRFFIGDVRDKSRLTHAMRSVDTVIHAAALKRIEVGHYNPVEMVKTNIDGAVNVIEAAQETQVRRVVALSTDKAYQPVSPYGASKALAEALFLAANNTSAATGPRFAVTRYGNVWGSQGSVVPKWKAVLSSSDIVPVTDPEATRFYMTLDEAVDLVLKAIHDMKGGEVFIPELPAYRLGDLAEAMGAKVKVTGLPKWEKRHENMDHDLCSETAPRMSVEELREILAA